MHDANMEKLDDLLRKNQGDMLSTWNRTQALIEAIRDGRLPSRAVNNSGTGTGDGQPPAKEAKRECSVKLENELSSEDSASPEPMNTDKPEKANTGQPSTEQPQAIVSPTPRLRVLCIGLLT